MAKKQKRELMKLTIARNSLLRPLGHVQSVVERRNTIPILANVVLQAEEGSLSLTATDMDMDIATSVGLIAAPTIGYYNYKAITSAKIPAKYRPKNSLVIWNWACIVIMTMFAVAFVYTRIFV